jgi:hypothetical protein
MNVLQPHHGDIPEKKDEAKENQTGEDQKSYEDSLLRLMVQSALPKSNVKCQSSKFK